MDLLLGQGCLEYFTGWNFTFCTPLERPVSWWASLHCHTLHRCYLFAGGSNHPHPPADLQVQSSISLLKGPLLP